MSVFNIIKSAAGYVRPYSTPTIRSYSGAYSYYNFYIRVTLPTYAVGDILIMAVTSGISGVTITTPDGWTLLGSALSTNGVIYLFYKYASNTNETIVYCNTSTNDNFYKYSFVYAVAGCGATPIAGWGLSTTNYVSCSNLSQAVPNTRVCGITTTSTTTWGGGTSIQSLWNNTYISAATMINTPTLSGSSYMSSSVSTASGAVWLRGNQI